MNDRPYVMRSVDGFGSESQPVPIHNGAWLSLVERCVRDAEIGGSNPLAPTILVTHRNNRIERLSFQQHQHWVLKCSSDPAQKARAVRTVNATVIVR